MRNVLFQFVGIWILVIVAIIFIAASSGATDEIAGTAATTMNATANMSQMPGTLEAVQSFPVWKWAIAPLVGFVVSGVVLFKNRNELSNR
jgi:hypothetical protein